MNLKLVSKVALADKVSNMESVMTLLLAFDERMDTFTAKHPEYQAHTAISIGPDKILVVTAVLKDAEADKRADR
jgi:hypothetical protein